MTKSPPSRCVVIGFPLEDVFEHQLRSNERTVQIVSSATVRDGCARVQKGGVDYVLMGPLLRNYDVVVMETVARAANVPVVKVARAEHLVSTLNVLLKTEQWRRRT